MAAEVQEVQVVLQRRHLIRDGARERLG